MSPTRRPSSVTGLRRGVGTGSEKPASETTGEVPSAPSLRTKPVRITVDLDPELYKRLNRWAKEAALELDLDRLPVADVVRGFIRLLDNADVQDDLREAITAAREMQ